MRSFSNAIIHVSSRCVALSALGIFLLFCIFVLPNQSAASATYSGGAGSPDLSFFYSPDELYNMAEQFGSAGRAAYVQARFTFDLIFPIVYGLFLTTSISWLIGRLTEEGSTWRLVNLLPAVGVLFDFLENITASIVIGRYPASSPAYAALAPVFTFIKWILVSGSFLALFYIGIVYLVRRLKKQAL